MSEAFDFASIPHVLEDDELPSFVLGIAPDERESITLGDCQYRRGSDRYNVEWPVGDSGTYLRAQVIAGADGLCYVYAAAEPGQLLQDWWPLLKQEVSNAARPFLSAGASGECIAMRPVNATAVDLTLPVTVLPPTESIGVTLAVAGLGSGGMTAEMMGFAYLCSFGVMKAALLTFLEYRTLVSEVPNVEVQWSAGPGVGLDLILEVAAEISPALGWVPC